MNRLDQIILTLPFLLSLAAIYVVLVWKPRQSDSKIVARVSRLFWSTAILMVIAVVVYASFFRG